MKASTTRLVVRAAPFVVAVAAFVVAMGAAFAQGEPAASSSATSTSPAEAAKPASVPSSAPSPSPAPRPVPPPPLIDDGTPRQATRGFLEAAGAGRFQEAARYLDVRGIQWGEQTPVEAAEQLGLLLQRRIWVDVESIDDTPEGDPSDGADAERIAAVEVDGHEIPITLTRISRSGGRRWVFSAATVARIPQLSRELGYDSWAMRIVPERHRESRLFGLWAWQWAGILVAALVAFPLGWLLAYLVVAVLKRATDRTAVSWDGRIVDGLNRVFRFGVGWLVMVLVILTLDMPPRLVNRWSPALSIPLILATGILIVQAIRGLTAVFLESVPDDQELNTRGLRTQLVFLRKIGSVAVGLVTLGIALMQFEVVRSVGWSLLASAGVAGVALGFAAQKSLAAVVGGLQLSITQPIRLGDSVVIQGQWGTVEEIALTYVRLKLFDDRRLVVPIDKLLSEIFENWSTPGDSMLGVVELAVDPSAPVPRLRDELGRIAAEHSLHDGRECKLQVIDANEHRVLVRCRVSTSDVGQVFQLRCDVREAMIDFIQGLEGGRYLPRRRYEAIERSS